MPAQKHTREIGGHRVLVLEFTGRKNFRILTKLAGYVGPALSEALGGVKQGGSVMDADIDFQRVVQSIIKQIDDDQELLNFCLSLLEQTYIDDEPVEQDQFDELFSGPKIISLLPRVLGYVLEVNFGDFSELGAGIMSQTGNGQSSGKRQSRDG